jgi:hypothetical protein
MIKNNNIVPSGTIKRNNIKACTETETEIVYSLTTMQPLTFKHAWTDCYYFKK